MFKPELRKRAITRIYNEALEEAGVPTRVVEVVDDKKRGLTVRLERTDGADEAAVEALLGSYTRPWEWAS